MNQASAIRPELLTLSAEQLRALMPYFWLFGGCCLTLVLAVIKSISPKWPVVLVGVAACVMAALSSLDLPFDQKMSLFDGMMVSDGFSRYFNVVFLAAAALTSLASVRYLDRENLNHPEYHILLLFSALGMMLMASALDLIVIFIALEIMSIVVYCLVGFRRTDRRSNEAALKYFILGSAASAILLYGTALLYGATSSTQINTILSFILGGQSAATPMLTLGAWLVVAGFLFKVAAVPFHMWMPDVYEGAPAPVTGFMTTGLKAAAFATFVRVFIATGYGKQVAHALETNIHHVIWVCAVLTMLVGNLVALTQTNLKRMLAYSSIAHTGYLLVGFLAAPRTEQGFAPVVMYLVAYAAMNLGAFVFLTLIASREDRGLNLHDISGLATRRPWLAFAMAVFLFSMAGLPPTAGFAAKYLLFASAVQAGEIWLVVIGVLCSAISVYYYLRVLVYMYMREPAGAAPAPAAGGAFLASAVVALMTLVTLQVGVLPARWMESAKRAVTGF